MFNFGDNVDRDGATRSTNSNEPETVDFRQTGDKSATKSTVDFVADLSPVLATVDCVASVYGALVLPRL